LQDLVDGYFGGTSPAWAFIGVGIPLVGCHGPNLGAVHEMNISFGGKGRDLGGPHLALASPMIFLWRLKHHLEGLDHHPRARVLVVMVMFDGHLALFMRKIPCTLEGRPQRMKGRPLETQGFHPQAQRLAKVTKTSP
jgi:hypothetical protein